MTTPSQAPTATTSYSQRLASARLLVRGLGWIAVFVPIVVFAVVWFRYAVSIPKWDDHALKAFLANLGHETTLSGKLNQFFKQHNEHRIVWDRLITWADYNLFGKLSYIRLMAVGNLSLVGLIAVFGLVLNRSGRSIWFLVPVACLIVNLGQWENMFWGMAALQNFSIILWVAGSLYLLAYTQHRIAAFGLAVLATLTSGNGLVIWPIVLVILLHQTLTLPATYRSWRPFLAWMAGALVMIGLYFWGYTKPEVTPPTPPGPGRLVQGWLAFNGAAAEALPIRGSVSLACELLGALAIGLLVFFGITLIRRHTLSRPLPPVAYFFIGLAGFLIGTSLVVTWSRVGFGFETLITSRYKIYSLTLLSLLYVYASVTTSAFFQKLTLAIGLVAGGALAWLSYPAYIDDTLRLRHYLQVSQFNWTYTTNSPKSTIDAQTAQLITNAPAFYDRCLPQLFSPAVGSAIQPDTLYQTATGYTLVVSATPAIAPTNPGTYLRLRSADRTVLATVQPTLNSSRWADLGLASRFSKGFTATINQTELQLPSGTYQLDILTTDTGGCQLHPTGKRIALSTATAPSVRTNW